jgi:Spy/CpxP family protein refolding chaperone
MRELRLAKKSQRVKMRDGRQALKQDKKSMREQMKPDMSRYMSEDKFDKKAYIQDMTKRAEARRAKMQKRRAQMLEARAEHMQKVFDILTPEQRKKWIELSKEL